MQSLQKDLLWNKAALYWDPKTAFCNIKEQDKIKSDSH